MQKTYFSTISTLLGLYVVINTIAFILEKQLTQYHINNQVLMGSNFLLVLVSCFNVWMHRKAAENKNPHVFSRSVMGGTFLKLMVSGAAAVIYLLAAGEKRSVYAIFVSMFLYIVYTVLEVRITLQLNQKK